MSGSTSQEQFKVRVTIGGFPSYLSAYIEIEGKSAGTVDLPSELSSYAPSVYTGTLIRSGPDSKPRARIEIEGKLVATVDFPSELSPTVLSGLYKATLVKSGG